MTHTIETASLRDFSWNSRRRELHGYSEIFAGDFPKEILVVSHHTNRMLTFRPVGPGHRLFDEDGWDGEQQVYEAAGGASDIVLLLSHAY